MLCGDINQRIDATYYPYGIKSGGVYILREQKAEHSEKVKLNLCHVVCIRCNVD